MIRKAKTSADGRNVEGSTMYVIHISLLGSLVGDSDELLPLVSNNSHRYAARNLHHLAAEAAAYCAPSTFHAEAPGAVFLAHNFGSNWTEH
jgi:hypothetical protein